VTGKPLTASAVVMCSHGGIVKLVASQSILTIDKAAVLVAGDLEHKPVSGCGLAPPAKACTATVSMLSGRSIVDKVAGKAVLLDSATGTTDSNPPGTFSVLSAGQTTVTEK
jgi:hypothetical protein